VACGAGFFLDQRGLNCTACPPGSSTHDFSNASSALDCLCRPGWENRTAEGLPAEACEPCRLGFHKEELANSTCAACPANSDTAAPAASDVAECVCRPGFTPRSLLSNSSVHNASLPGVGDASLPDLSDACVACPAGSFKPGLGNGACAPCPADHYCPPASAEPRACPANSSSLPGRGSPEACLCAVYLVLIQSNDTYKCEPCHADTYYARDPATSVGICPPCQPGAGSPAGSRSEPDCVCKPGFVVEPYAPDYTCSACSPGSYSAAANASACDACAPGKFAASVAASTCLACPSGTVALAPGMSACARCPASTWQDVELPGHLSAPCAPCPADSGHELTGVYDVFECDCAPGLYKLPNATGFVCSECEPGFSCSASAVSVVMTLTLGLPLSVEEFSPALQLDFREAVAATVDVEVSRVVIVSISAQALSRRLFSFRSLRRLLSGVVAVEFSITLDSASATNVSAVEVPTTAQLNEEIESRNLPSVEIFVAPSVVVYEQREICPPTSYCPGGGRTEYCRPFSRAEGGGATTAEQCTCQPGYYSLNATAACNKCPPGSFCTGDLAVEPCAPNATSAPGAGSREACFCQHGLWRGCTRTHGGAFIDNTGQPCAINFSAPCVQCSANDICFNDTLLHCPEHSASPAGSSQPSHCVCDGGFAVEYV
jgi:hypothetical protein